MLIGCGEKPPATDTAQTNTTDDLQQTQPAPVPAVPEVVVVDDPPLSLPQRVAFMAGHVEAGLALYRAGEIEMAAKHFLHPVSETHASEREGLDAIGFDADLFAAIADALADGVPAEQMTSQLQAAQKNLSDMATRAGGNDMAIIDFLMAKVAEEYAAGVSNGVVVEAGEYQDAFGFATVAAQRVAGLDSQVQSIATVRLEALLLSWPSAPV
ncbi:MAG: hypothetical protein AAFO81_03185, partial [Pseudomonadota bacterium]